MEEAQVSRTSLATAYIRGYHAGHDTPKIFDDFLAHGFLTEVERALVEQSLTGSLKLIDPALAASCPDMASALAAYMRVGAGPPITLSRGRYVEDTLGKAVGQGLKQYVILGAGMDTFAFRRPDMSERLQVFEVDHPATQTFKRQRLVDIGWEYPAQLHFVSVDFRRDQLADALMRSSYDPLAPGFFSWLGVTYYLSREAVFTTLCAIAGIAPPGSTVIFDYLDTDAFVLQKAAKNVRVMMETVQRLGEPMMTGFDPDTLAADLAAIGLDLHENLSPGDIEERYYQGRIDGYHACEHVHLAKAVVT